jgi:hypothetical protein
VAACTNNTFNTSACNGNGSCATSSSSCQFGCGAGNTCAACRQQNSENLLSNPGFDGSSTGWTVPGGVNAYSTADVEGCRASGSILMTDFTNSMSQCRPITGGATYFFGFRFRAQQSGHAGYCDVGFYTGLDCTGEISFDGAGIPAQVIPQGSSWGEAAGRATAPQNAVSAGINCIAAIGFGNYDQLYLSRTTIGF